MTAMTMITYRLLIILASFALVFSACSDSANQNTAGNQAANTAAATDPGPTPSNQITEADVAKLKWLEGSWRGMDGDKPFYERIRFEGSTMIVETLEDGSLTKVTETGKFELKDGEWGHTVGSQRSAASSITDDSVQFVPAKVPGTPEGAEVKGSKFRFERKDGGTWHAVLDVPAARGQPASQKVYKMEPWKAESKSGKE
jgi:hypothetical protein